MKSKKEKEINPPEKIKDKIICEDINKEMRSAYLNYSMSVITARALPDVRDGLKPVHRRILFSMNDMGIHANTKTKKSARVVGNTLGKFHPHGDSAVYEAMVRLTQDFKTRYPLVIGQGNFGSIDGDNAAAPRYTEAKLSRISDEMLKDINKNTVTWRANYDNTLKEPEVLPSVIPNLLLNGGLGIAVGMATNIPPHNITEVSEALLYVLDNEDATNEDLLKIIKGPDFPTGAVAYDKNAIKQAYSTGRGGVVCRGEMEVESSGSKEIILISSIPYGVNKSELLMKIGSLVQEKKIEGIRALRDESTDDIRIVIELKSSANPQKIIHSIYKYTNMQVSFNYNMVMLVKGIPKTLSLQEILFEFIEHRRVVVTRRTEFDLKKAKEREHILLGLSTALDHIDEVIAIIKKSKNTEDAQKNLIKKFKFTESQCNAILEMKLQRLSGLERKKIEDELKEINETIKKLNKILASKEGVDGEIKKELNYILDNYADKRRTKIVASSVLSISNEDLEADEDSVLVLTIGGYVKRTKPENYRLQKRGGVGVKDLKTKTEDVIQTVIHTNTHSRLLFFSTYGKVYQLQMFEIPEGKMSTRGKSMANFLALSNEEKITSVLPIKNDEKRKSLLFVTASGVVKKIDISQFENIRKNGIIAMALDKGDFLIDAVEVTKDDCVFLLSEMGKSIRFDSNDLRDLGRSARGVKGIALVNNDKIMSVLVTPKNKKDLKIITISEKGYGKATLAGEYKIQKRGGSGVQAMTVSDKTGKIVGAHIHEGDNFAVVAMSQQGQAIKLAGSDIPLRGRVTIGVRIMKPKQGDSVATTVIMHI